jgi:glycosyl transferase family 25
MKGYLINLEKRTDRLNNFINNVQTFLPDIYIERINAVDGTKLDLKNEDLKKNVNPWNFKNLNEKTLRGVIGCCQSHLNCYKKIIDSDDKYAIIFEDDCVFIKGKEAETNTFLKNLPIPKNFGIIWLNDWVNSVDSKLINDYYYLVKGGAKTTEAYIVSKEFAKILYLENCKKFSSFQKF